MKAIIYCQWSTGQLMNEFCLDFCDGTVFFGSAERSYAVKSLFHLFNSSQFD